MSELRSTQARWRVPPQLDERARDQESGAHHLGTVPTQRLFGLDIASDSELDDVLQRIVSRRRRPGSATEVVVTANVDHIVRYDLHPEERNVAERAALVLPDGAPLVWASKLLGRPLRRRLTGSDLFTILWPALRASELSVLLVAANQQVAAHAKSDYPAVNVVVAPMLNLDEPHSIQAWSNDLLQDIKRRGIDIVLLAIGAPAAHRISRFLIDAAPATGGPIVLMLGASPEFYFGLRPRAPLWMQSWGLEWLYRLRMEPRRMYRRYLIEDLRFVAILGRQWRTTRRAKQET